MTPAKDVTMAARVPLDLREEAEQVVANVRERGTNHLRRDPEFDLSSVIRLAVRRFVDVELHGMPEDLANGHLFGPRTGAHRRRDRATSTAAARDVAPRSGSQRRRALEVIVAAGARGMTTDEVINYLEANRERGSRPPAVNGVARRVTDLYQAGAIEPAMMTVDDVDAGVNLQIDRAGELVPRTRTTRHGSQATVYIATAKGRAWLQEGTA